MQGFVVLLLTAGCWSLSVALAEKAEPQWYRVSSLIGEEYFYSNEHIDFRGCYDETTCLYVSDVAVVTGSKHVGAYVADEEVWVVSLFAPFEAVVVFGSRPDDVEDAARWISPVAGEAVRRPPVFHAAPNASEFSKEVQQLVDSLDEGELKRGVELLSEYHTRNSLSKYAVEASFYLADRVDALGCQRVSRDHFKNGYSPNVVCVVPGAKHPQEYVVMGAHYDCRASGAKNTTQRAPGADDNGSGVSALLEILDKSRQFTFERSLMFAFFSGEEQGLYGSQSLASKLSKNKTMAVHAMINLDMIGVPEKGQEKTLWWTAQATSSSLTQLGIEVTRMYLGKDIVIKTEDGCCSDNQPFHERGIPSAGLFEAESVSNNPNYHESSDLPDTLTYSHVLQNAKATAALMATIAVPLKKRATNY